MWSSIVKTCIMRYQDRNMGIEYCECLYLEIKPCFEKRPSFFHWLTGQCVSANNGNPVTICQFLIFFLCWNYQNLCIYYQHIYWRHNQSKKALYWSSSSALVRVQKLLIIRQHIKYVFTLKYFILLIAFHVIHFQRCVAGIILVVLVVNFLQYLCDHSCISLWCVFLWQIVLMFVKY